MLFTVQIITKSKCLIYTSKRNNTVKFEKRSKTGKGKETQFKQINKQKNIHGL